jgi:hypothetical protein
MSQPADQQRVAALRDTPIRDLPPIAWPDVPAGLTWNDLRAPATDSAHDSPQPDEEGA